jgi:hypothetical protein
MRTILLWFFLGLQFSILSQEQSMISLEKLDLSYRKLSEYNFIPTEDGAFYVTNKAVTKALQVKDSKGSNLSSIFYCSRKKNKYSTPKLVDIEFYNHIGSFAVNDEGDYIIFTGRQNPTATTFGLFQTEKIKGKWSNPTLVFKNMEQFNFTDPFLSLTGDTLIFSTDMAGGNGGLDIYYAIGTRGDWSRFENLGSDVNTLENERFPCLNKNTLYFSSKREEGIGGMDIYSNPIEDGKATKSLLLHSKVNSAADDFSISFYEENLFFSSNRDGSDDIFELTSRFPEFDCIPSIPLVRCYEFSDENSELRDTSGFIYRWSMGDGTEYEGLNAEHCFKDSGTYIVELNIYDIVTNKKIINEATYELAIEDPDQIEIVIPEILKKGIPLEFKVIKDVLSDSSTCYWDFGDGQFAVGESVNHDYLQVGVYEISVGRVYFRGGEEFRICTTQTVNIP